MKVRQKRPRDAGSVIERRRTDGSIAYMLKWRSYTRTVAAHSKREAMALLPTFVAEAQSGEIDRRAAEARAKGEQPTLAAWAETFLAQHVSQDPDRLATRKAYEGALNGHVLPTLGDKKLGDVTGAMVREALQAMYRNGRAIRTIQLTHAVLNRCLAEAVEDGVLARNPAPKFKKLHLGDGESRADVARRKALTHGQVQAILGACRDPSMRVFIAILAACGLRPGECLALRWCDVDLEACVLRVRRAVKSVYMGPGDRRVWTGKTKTKSSVRDLAIGVGLAELLRQERERLELLQYELRALDPAVRRLKPFVPDDAFILPFDACSPEGLTRPCDPASMREKFVRVAARAGIATTPHALRHTAISHSIAGGLGLADVAQRAGHSSVLMTAQTYVHAVSESQRKAALIGDSLLAPAAPNVERLPNAGGGDA